MEPAANEPPTDDQAFEAELTALIPHMRAFARSLTGDAAQADDLAQDALCSAWRRRSSFQLGTNLRAWTFTILRNQFLSERRRAWRPMQLDREVAERSLVATDNPTAMLELEQLRQALKELPVEQREALVLVGAGGLSYEEAAEVSQCAVGTVKSRVSRARKALGLILERGFAPRSTAACADAGALIIAELDDLQRNRHPQA